MFLNHDSLTTFTYFMARSTKVAYAFEWEKILKYHLMGKTCGRLANEHNIYYSENNMTQGSSVPALELYTIIFKHFIGIYSRSEVSIYRTIGPLVP